MAGLIYTNTTAGESPAITTAAGSGVDISLRARPKTDIYTSPIVPGCLFDYSAPVVCRRMRRDDFLSAKVTASAVWHAQFDQAGLVFTLPTRSNPDPSADNAGDAASHPAWVKAGIECNDGDVCISVVARAPDGWCDWSLIPLSLVGVVPGPAVPVTLRFTRLKNALMVWLLRASGNGQPMQQQLLVRKVPWVFLDDQPDTVGDDVLVGAYAARPDPSDVTTGSPLEVSFSGLEIETRSVASQQ